MVASQTSGEFALMRLKITVFCSTNSWPKTMRAISTVSRARRGCVTEPMNGLSVSVRCAATMS